MLGSYFEALNDDSVTLSGLKLQCIAIVTFTTNLAFCVITAAV